MVKIRLRRVGAKKQPHYRLVVADSRFPRDGKFIETIGHYNPRTEPPTVEIDSERALHWLLEGAQPSEAVRRMLDKAGLIARAEAIKRGEVLPVEPALEPEPPAVEEVVPEPLAELGDEDLDLDEEEEGLLDEEEEEEEEGWTLDDEFGEVSEDEDWAPEEDFGEESEDEVEGPADLDVDEDEDVDEE